MRAKAIAVFTVFLCLAVNLATATKPTLTILYSFTGYDDGGQPVGLVRGSDGNFYGTTYFAQYCCNDGTVFRISRTGELKVFHLFDVDRYEGGNPRVGLAEGSDGNFYGTTSAGGGTVYRINTNGSFEVLHWFTNTVAGIFPQAALARGSDANFYGTTSRGGPSNNGGIFRISPEGTLTTLHLFGSEQATKGALVQGLDGNFYGTTANGGSRGNGTVFKMRPTGRYETLCSFPASVGWGHSGLVLGHDGNFYGTTDDGGEHGGGTFVRISPSGTLTTLCQFDGIRASCLIQAHDGNFYGTSFFGGTFNHGTIFRVTASGQFTNLFNFSDGLDGGGPTDLVQGDDGDLYGTAWHGGANGPGTVFKLSLPHDLAVVKLKAPQRITLHSSFGQVNRSGNLFIAIQNRGLRTETIPDLATLSNLVTVTVQSLSTNCPTFPATLVPPKASFPIQLAPTETLNLAFRATFHCANDPLRSTGTGLHSDYRTMAVVDLSVLGEQADTTSTNNVCPRPPTQDDPGCGHTLPSGELGGDVLTDVVVK